MGSLSHGIPSIKQGNIEDFCSLFKIQVQRLLFGGHTLCAWLQIHVGLWKGHKFMLNAVSIGLGRRHIC
jgi:hypothetical protein